MKSKPEFCKRNHPWNSENTRYQNHKNGRVQRYCYICKLEASRNQHHKRKQKVVDYYGGCCSCCNETVLDFLAVDHIGNDGAAHRKEQNLQTGWHTYYWLIRNNFPDG